MTLSANEEYKRWLLHVKDPALKEELEAIKDNSEEIESRFAVPMKFGTAGLRAVMGAGTARMNIYTVARATYAVATLILRRGGSEQGVVIAYDSRNNSRLFAETAARVFVADGIKCYMFDNIRPTPELSFAILHLGCMAGINITASHNPKEYNGYKVYWSDGAQLPPSEADAVSEIADKTDVFSVKLGDLDKVHSDIAEAGVDEAYIAAVLNCRIRPEMTKKYGNSLCLMYTPIHGTGYVLAPEVLKRAGITNLRTVPQQMVPDGNFPTVKSPNPEYTACFDLAISQADGCSLMIGTDPDGDRIGVCIRDGEGKYFALSGNQIGALLIDYIIKGRKITGTLPENACAIKSIVSGELFDTICDFYGVKHINVLTGFKYIGEKIKQWQADGSNSFIFGYEESHGYLTDGYARDKDGIAATLLVAEMASYYASLGKTLYDALTELYAKFGYFAEATVESKVGGIDPMSEMSKTMAGLRENMPSSIRGTKVTKVRDFKSGIVTDLVTLEKSATGLPKADMLYFELEDSTKIIVRPSGTEPKIKLYILTRGKDEAEAMEKSAYYSQFVL